jgi:hypothetical protein
LAQICNERDVQAHLRLTLTNIVAGEALQPEYLLRQQA